MVDKSVGRKMPNPKNQKIPSNGSYRTEPKGFFRMKNVALLLILLLFAAGFGFLGYKYLETQDDYKEAQDTVERLSNPEEAVKQEAINLKNRVSQLVEVPEGQEPTIATVQDVSKLQGQDFFKNAQNGDKVLIYAEAKKAILYRPSTDKIIEVAPVNIGDNQANNKAGSIKKDQ